MLSGYINNSNSFFQVCCSEKSINGCYVYKVLKFLIVQDSSCSDKPEQPIPDKPEQPIPDKPEQSIPDKSEQPIPDKP